MRKGFELRALRSFCKEKGNLVISLIMYFFLSMVKWDLSECDVVG